MSVTVPPEIVQQIRNAVLLVSGAIDDATPGGADELSVADAFGAAVDEVSAAAGVDVIAAFVSVAVALLDRLATETGRPREDLWREIAERFAVRVTG